MRITHEKLPPTTWNEQRDRLPPTLVQGGSVPIFVPVKSYVGVTTIPRFHGLFYRNGLEN
jgi:hypothetical protein